MAVAPVIDFKLLGIKDLDAKFRKLTPRLQKKILMPSLRAGGKTVKQAVKAAVPKDTGLLRRSIQLKSIKRSRSRIGMVVSTKGREFFGIDPASKWFYPAIIEYGYVRNGVTYPAQPYIRGTAERLRSEVQRKIGADIRAKLTAVAKQP